MGRRRADPGARRELGAAEGLEGGRFALSHLSEHKIIGLSEGSKRPGLRRYEADLDRLALSEWFRAACGGTAARGRGCAKECGETRTADGSNEEADMKLPKDTR